MRGGRKGITIKTLLRWNEKTKRLLISSDSFRGIDDQIHDSLTHPGSTNLNRWEFWS